jgi:hypothetical protein
VGLEGVRGVRGGERLRLAYGGLRMGVCGGCRGWGGCGVFGGWGGWVLGDLGVGGVVRGGGWGSGSLGLGFWFGGWRLAVGGWGLGVGVWGLGVGSVCCYPPSHSTTNICISMFCEISTLKGKLECFCINHNPFQGMYYKTSRISNLWKMDIFCSELLYFLLSVMLTGLDKHTKLPHNPYITNSNSL